MLIRTAILMLMVLMTAGAPAEADDRPAALRSVGFEQKLGAQLPPDLPFQDDQGRRVRLGDYFAGRPVILTLAYYRCEDLCPLTLDGLVRTLRALSFRIGKEFDVLTISFDPNDTAALAAAKKRELIHRYGRPEAESGWHFLTGGPEAVGALTREIGFLYNSDRGTGRFGHATGILLLTPGGRISRYFYGIEYSPRDLRLGLIEASANQIGSAIDQLLLFCYRYDPAAGKYGARITNVLRLGSVTTVFALGGFILLLLRRERRRDSKPEGAA